ncbi:MAG: MMPL family transporter, partial [Chloroflexota bacterium]|nr:MMPL family transporter [Chloroflexota bacterium]
MRRMLSTTTLARASARHPWRTIGAWIAALAITMVLMVTFLGDALTTDVTTLTNNPESTQADNLIRDRLGDANATISEIAVVHSDTLTVDDPAFRAHVESLYGTLTGVGDGLVTGLPHYYMSGEESLVSADRHTTLVPFTIPDDATSRITEVHEAIAGTSADGAFQVLVTGQATLDIELKEVAEKDLAKGESIGISVALVVLAIVIGAVVAAFLPILLAIVAIILALGATALLGQVMELPFAVVNIMGMMGLAVGIDYALFVVSRYREERAKGVDKVEAIAITGGTAGRTVLVSGLTVAIALGGMLIMPDTSNRAIGAGAALVVLATVATSMSLLPALLSLFGDKLNAIRVRVPSRFQRRQAEAGHGFWDRTTALVMARPLVSLVLAAGLLLAAASSILDMDQGEVGVEALPTGIMSRDAYVILEREFGFGQDLPAIVAIDGDTADLSVQAAIDTLNTAIASDPGFIGAETESHPEAALTIVRVHLAGDALSGDAMAAVERLRSEHIPAAFDGTEAEALVTGKTAFTVDLTDATETYVPIVILFVLALSFILLTVAFHSIVVPVKAILLNLLSVGATWGILVLVFQEGFLADFFGF